MSEAADRTAEGATARSVFATLKLVFGIVPIVAGLDKFTNLLVDWSKYIAPAFASMLPFSGRTFMYIVGIIEIVAGLGVLATRWTRAFAMVVGIWLLCIVRDVVMAISAFCLARLAAAVPARDVRARTMRTATV